MKDEADLAWFFCEAAGALGLRAQPIEPSVRGTNEVDEGVSEHQLEAATRHRRISDALSLLTHTQQHTLRLAYAPMTPTLAAMGALAGRFVPLVLEALGADEARALTALARDTGKPAARAAKRLRAIATEVEALVADTVKAYALAKRTLARLERAARRARIVGTLWAA